MEFRDPLDIANEDFERALSNAFAEPTTAQQNTEFEEQLRNAVERDRHFFSDVDREQQFFNSLERQVSPINRDDVDPEMRHLIAESDDELPTLPKAAGKILKARRALEKIAKNPLIVKLFTNPPDSKQFEDALVTMFMGVDKDTAIQYLDDMDAIAKSGRQRLIDEADAKSLIVEHFRSRFKAAAL